MRVGLHNSTLVLPQQDYALLLAAAQEGWQPGMLTSHPVLSTVTNFTVDPAHGPPALNQPLHLSLLAIGGLGFRANKLTCVPEAPLPPGYLLPRLLSKPGSSSDGDLSSGAKIGIGVGVGVAGALLLAGVALLFWLLNTRKRCGLVRWDTT